MSTSGQEPTHQRPQPHLPDGASRTTSGPAAVVAVGSINAPLETAIVATLIARGLSRSTERIPANASDVGQATTLDARAIEVVDIGQLDVPIADLDQISMLIAVIRPTVEGVIGLSDLVQEVQEGATPGTVGVVEVGEGPYGGAVYVLDPAMHIEIPGICPIARTLATGTLTHSYLQLWRRREQLRLAGAVRDALAAIDRDGHALNGITGGPYTYLGIYKEVSDAHGTTTDHRAAAEVPVASPAISVRPDALTGAQPSRVSTAVMSMGPAPTNEDEIHVRVLGDIHVEAAEPLTPQQMAVVTYLALHRKATIDQLGEVFWPNSSDKARRKRVADTLTICRSAMGRDLLPAAINGIYQAANGLVTDLDVFEQRLAGATGQGDVAVACHLRHALQLVSGPIFNHASSCRSTYVWIDLEHHRSTWEQKISIVAERCISLHLDSGEPAAAIAVAASILRAMPVNSRLTELLMVAHASNGDPVAASRAFRSHELALRDLDLGLPDPTLVEAHRALRRHHRVG